MANEQDPRDIIEDRNRRRAEAARARFSDLRNKLTEGLQTSRSVHMMTREDEGDTASHRREFLGSAHSRLREAMSTAEAALSPEERARMPKKSQ